MTYANPDRRKTIIRLLNPKSIAVIGASSDFGKVNGRPLKHLIEKGYAGRILPVNPKYEEIAGLVCYPSVEALPEAADLAIIALPAAHVCDCVEKLGRKGIRTAVIFSSGFGEMGDEGKALEKRLAETAKAARVILLGPNCLGFVNAFDNVYATFSQYADGETGAGPIAFVTQSGAFGTAIAALVRQRGLGLGYFLNTGNQADLSFAELMMAIVEDPRIKVAAGYLEGITDGDALVRLARKCQELGKPLILTKVGRMSSGARAAASHTGALAVSDAVFDAVVRQYGVLRARNEEQMLDMLEVFCQPRRACGSGLGIATQSGGAGVMMADRAEEVGLTVPELGAATQARLAAVMPAFGAAGNPVDVTGQFVARPELLTESVVSLLDDPDIDVAIVWLQLMTAHVEPLLGIFREIQQRTVKPFLVCWVAAPDAAIKGLRAADIPVYTAGERAVEAAAALARYGMQRKTSEDAVSPSGSPACPGTTGSGMQPTVEASSWLREAGIPMAHARLAESEDHAVALWRDSARPVALKIESPDIPHKTEIDGVILNIDDEAGIRSGYRTLIERARAAMPDARLSGVLVQEMAEGHVELVIGVQRDPVFGMIVMVGFGGILVEVLKDVTFRRAPFDRSEAYSMLDDLRMSRILDGVRGKPAVDREAISLLLSRLSHWAAAMEPRLSELDLNPVLVGEAGPSVVDCVMIFEE
ncbi:acetate--CoA ligase family protein [Nitratireductor indicus]|uniref:acetate--CoA ligase family protein n=1 Tax=Nitratireductor indicus TaxID=721133 RepID=UPI00287634AD|nr:acetate--CoA ligase family protein [Nitratireductor indicus]MDS1136879.1 acetate--CoA ligase family protein [Nitratireductor indicus]